jgi:hypothetical protein
MAIRTRLGVASPGVSSLRLYGSAVSSRDAVRLVGQGQAFRVTTGSPKLIGCVATPKPKALAGGHSGHVVALLRRKQVDDADGLGRRRGIMREKKDPNLSDSSLIALWRLE